MRNFSVFILLAFIFLVPQMAQGGITISGTVCDDSGETLVGASVCLVKDKSRSVLTDSEGKFVMSDLSSGDLLRVSYVGCDDTEQRVDSLKTNYEIVLHTGQSQLDEVVVVGYSTQKKVDLTGAVASVNVKALGDRPITNATSALAGLAAGLSVSNTGGNTPGYESQSILVRGQGTLNNAAPLVVVDGMTGIAISDVNPQDIDNISVLKDAASAAIYGSRAANGVILITTRQGSERMPRVTYSGNVSFEKVAKRLNLVPISWRYRMPV